MTISNNYYDSEIVAKIRLNAKKMEEYRDNKTFSEIELVLGFSAYIYWLAGVIRLEGTKEQDEYLDASSETARQVALEFIGMIKHEKTLVNAIKMETDFEPEIELELGWAKEKNNQWKFSLTRAVILIARQLAYATIDYSASNKRGQKEDDLDFLKFAEIADLYQEAMIWAGFIIGMDNAQKLFAMQHHV